MKIIWCEKAKEDEIRRTFRNVKQINVFTQLPKFYFVFFLTMSSTLPFFNSFLVSWPKNGHNFKFNLKSFLFAPGKPVVSIDIKKSYPKSESRLMKYFRNLYLWFVWHRTFTLKILKGFVYSVSCI